MEPQEINIPAANPLNQWAEKYNLIAKMAESGEYTLDQLAAAHKAIHQEMFGHEETVCTEYVLELIALEYKQGYLDARMVEGRSFLKQLNEKDQKHIKSIDALQAKFIDIVDGKTPYYENDELIVPTVEAKSPNRFFMTVAFLAGALITYLMR